MADARPNAPAFLGDVIERQFGLAPYVTAAVWSRVLDEASVAFVQPAPESAPQFDPHWRVAFNVAWAGGRHA